jgi:hypothetical protein
MVWCLDFFPAATTLFGGGRWRGGCGIWVSEVVVLFQWWDGGEVLNGWRVGSDAVSVWLMSCVFSFPWYLILWPFTNLLRFAWFYLSRWAFQICWDLHISGIWLNFTASVLTVSSISTGVHQLSTYEAAFWIMMSRISLIRVRKSVFSGVSTGWVDVFSGGLWWISIDVL